MTYAKSAEYYDLIYSVNKDYRKESRTIGRLARRYGRSGGSLLLDVACGTGRHLYYLKRSFKAEGLDASPNMLRIARKRNPGIRFRRGDMATFRLAGTYDVITCLFSAIGHMGTVRRLRQAVKNMASHLKPGGVLIVEPWLTPARFQRGRIDAVFIHKPKLKIVRMNRTQIKGRQSLIIFHHLIGTPARIQYFTESHTLGLFTHREYQEAFRRSGLIVKYDRKGLMGRGLYIGSKNLKG